MLDLAAAASAGAALVHAAAAGGHADHETVQYLFVWCAVLQLGWAALAVVVQAQDPARARLRLVAGAGMVLNAGAVAAWLTQRTVGLSVVDALREPEDIGGQDILAALLGTLAVLAAGLSLVPRLRLLTSRWIAAGGVAALLLTVPAMAADHGGAGSHSHGTASADDEHTHGDSAEAAEGAEHEHAEGEEHTGPGHEDMVSVDPEDRCDLGFNTAEFNDTTMLVDQPHGHSSHSTGVDFTVAEWAEVFADESIGIDAAQLTEWIEGDEYRSRDVLAGDLTPTIEPDAWVPMTDPAQCATLADQLQQARDAAARYSTLADAQAAGYVPGSLYAPGQGAHFSRFDYIADEGFDPAEPELLMFDGTDPDSRLMGMMYYLVDFDGLPEEVGFAGPNDAWHAHESLCRDATGQAVSWRECDEGRGTVTDESYGYMLHTWLVPGCESDWGVFSAANPRLPYLPGAAGIMASSAEFPFASDITLTPGCNSGTAVTDPLSVDDSGDGPTLR